nr:hypothetical protein [Tanacetum cinerariifolium]
VKQIVSARFRCVFSFRTVSSVVIVFRLLEDRILGSLGSCWSTVLINNLDASNPLYTNPNDSSSIALISFKLLEFVGLIKLPTCVYDANKELGLHTQLMQFLMDINDCYQSIRSALLTRDHLSDVKDADITVLREESYKGIHKGGPAVGVLGSNPEYIGQNYYSGWIINFGANQHLTVLTVGMLDFVDISSLNIVVGHPNGTIATISHVVNLKLTNNVVLYDVLVVPGYFSDLKRETILGTGSRYGGLHLFNMDNDKSVGQNKQENIFPLSDHKSKKLGELIHLNL